MAVLLLCLCGHWYHHQHAIKSAALKCINSTSHFSLFLMYLFFLWEVTYFKNCFMIKKHSNQLFKMSTLI